MSEWFFLLGNTPSLSLLELRSVYPELAVVEVSPSIARAEVPDTLSAQLVMERLGGLVKIFKLEHPLTDPTPEGVEAAVIEFLAQLPQPKITFSLAELGRDHLPTISLSRLKQALKEAGKAVRFVEGPRSGLSASVLLHHKGVLEVAILQTTQGVFLTTTAAIQNIDEWTVRDRSKPYADRKKGMLPPKVARMMVNCALGNHTPSIDDESKPLLYDPFCGSGTTLIEAATLGCDVIGSDLDTTAVFGTQANLDWIKDIYRIECNATVFMSDVSKAPKVHFKKAVTHLVTEPFLGKQTPPPALVPNMYRGLEKMYLGAFKHWTGLLADNAQVVIIFPLVEIGKKSFTLESLIDKIAPLGYTMSSEPVLYHRPKAVVQRQIYRFTFKKR